MFNGPLVVGEKNVEKLKTMKEKERERDIEALRRLEMCHVCIEKEKKILCFCTVWLLLLLAGKKNFNYVF
jgi:hypothetical protein